MAIESYEVMSSEPCDNGLCGHCDMVPCSSSPNGPIMCEGRGCYNAYIEYADDKMTRWKKRALMYCVTYAHTRA